MEIRRLVVTGMVQGVGYRYGMMVEAMHLDISGWVRNRLDGSVEALIAGSPESVAAIIAWARRGPPGAQVTHLAVEIGEGSFESFVTRPSSQG